LYHSTLGLRVTPKKKRRLNDLLLLHGVLLDHLHLLALLLLLPVLALARLRCP